ncbi:MAG: class I SAM-dependent RNA methyltransferase [Oscillospiraceae bacterium]|nr:class I SAM-dependent RNA methyltransferase [Oscillospiraceae bacterium]
MDKRLNVSACSSAQLHTVTITGYDSGGEGVARMDDGKVVFVRGAARGDVLRIKLTKELPRSARGEIVQLMTPSAHRIEPDCPYYPGCGGCDFRHISYSEELEAKLLRVNDALSRIGGSIVCADEILSTGQIDGYRNKAVFHSNGARWGFYKAGSHDVIAIKRCALLKGDLNFALGGLCASGEKAEITLRSGHDGIGAPLTEVLDGLTFRVSGFFQVNTDAALLLFQKAREYAALSADETLVDLYCGVGSMAIFVGRDAGRVLGIEQNSAAIKAAHENARRNGFTHIDFVSADAAKWDAGGIAPDCVIVDPPRSGLSKGAISKILELSPKRLVYVSCDPATLSRDIRRLEGYVLKKACAVDMFPRTANVESCCLLVRG